MKTKEVADRLEISPDKVRELTELGIIPGHIIERPQRNFYFYQRDQIEEFVRAGTMQEKYEINLDG